MSNGYLITDLKQKIFMNNFNFCKHDMFFETKKN